MLLLNVSNGLVHVQELSEKKSNVSIIMSHVNPYGSYSREPAPMGIADYGLGENEEPYSYNSTSFEGIVNIFSLNAYNSTYNTNEVSIQLNLVLEFFNMGKEYVYWVQNAALLDTGNSSSGHFIQILNNIWNASSTSSMLYNSSLSGNGTVYSSSSGNYYCDYAQSSLAGNEILVNYPLLLKLRVNASQNAQGVPELVFEYDNGYGWIIYDNVIFNFAGNINRYYGFVVNGNNYTPYGSFFDSELVIGGPGNGMEVTDLGSNILMQLEYWNGHNYQRVKNAYNFGSNTAETMDNVKAYYYTENGISYSDLTGGQGSLTQLYSSTDIGTITIHTAFKTGTLNIDNISYIFYGYQINITLVPGNYNYLLFNNSIEYEYGNFSLNAGFNLNIIANKNIYNITFFETGLNAGMEWSIVLNNNTYYSNTDSILIFVANGSYQYRIFNVSGYSPNIHSGIIIIAGDNVVVTIIWNEIKYSVTFKEYGLTLPIKWIVELNGVKEYSLNSTILFLEGNGSYEYTVFSINNYFTHNGSGVVSVAGKNLIIDIYWEKIVYNVTFFESGLINGTVWSISLNNITEYSNTSYISFNMSNGTYFFNVEPIAGYRANIYSGSVTVNGNIVNYTIIWKRVTYCITFLETGLPINTKWGIELGNNLKTSSFNTIIFNVANGTYMFSTMPVKGYSSATQGTVSVAGKNVSEIIAWSEVLFRIEFIETGLENGTLWSVSVNNTTEYSTNATIIFEEPEGYYNYIIHIPDGYNIVKSSIQMFVDSNTTVNLSFSKAFNLEFILVPILLFLVIILVIIKIKHKNK